MLKAAIVACAFITCTAAFAADHITLRGCVTGDVEECVFITAPEGTYALDVSRKPKPGRGISVTGTTGSSPRKCRANSGVSVSGIKVERWSYVHLQCAK